MASPDIYDTNVLVWEHTHHRAGLEAGFTMPRQGARPCRHRGCPGLVTGERTYCAERHQLEEDYAKAERDRRRGTAHQRGYGARWQRERAAYLAANPLCTDPMALHPGRTVAGEVVDHIKPHRGKDALFWNQDNWQTLCRPCHTEKTARGE